MSKKDEGAPAREVVTLRHTDVLGEVIDFRIELPLCIAEGDRPIDRAVRSAYLQGFAAGAKYGTDEARTIAALEGPPLATPRPVG